jgi:hypothetical protein
LKGLELAQLLGQLGGLLTLGTPRSKRKEAASGVDWRKSEAMGL